MRLLAWDTSAKAGALVAMEWDASSNQGRASLKLVTEWALDVGTTHSERLLWGIHELLEAANWKLEDIDVFGAGVGPGSFTGLRIGITTARTLGHTLRKPVIGVSSLAALARPAALWLAQQKKKTILVATTDAAKGELFGLWGSAKSVMDCAAMAEDDQPGLWKRGVEEQVIRPDELMKAVKKKLSESGSAKSKSGKGGASSKSSKEEEVQWLALGEGRLRYPEAWKALPKSLELEMPVPFSDQVQGRYLGLLVWEAYQAGLARDALKIHPRYLRASDAEIKLKAGQLPPGPTRGGSGG